MNGTTSPQTRPMRFMPPKTTRQKRAATNRPVSRGSNPNASLAETAMLLAWMAGPVIVVAKIVATA